ncbi:winged helix-turn-helix domain-containing protein [Candidatus Omnitrophota bacterium]
MIIEIGIVAGEIWHYLDKNGEILLYSLIKNIDRDRDTILMSLGWLAREGHIVLSQGHNKGELMVQLRKQNAEFK